MCDVKSWWKCEDLQGEKIGVAKAGRLVYEKENAASQKLKVYAFKKETLRRRNDLSARINKTI